MDTSESVVTSLSVTWQSYGILGHSVPKLTLALWSNPNHAAHFHTHAGTQKAIECLECPERWPRLINGYGHFRERCDVTERHLAKLWNFGTLRPKINPCPMEQPQLRCTLPHSCRNPKKQSNVLSVPNGGPAP